MKNVQIRCPFLTLLLACGSDIRCVVGKQGGGERNAISASGVRVTYQERQLAEHGSKAG